MKELSELNFPEDIRYAETHEWARSEDGEVRVGITDYAQDQLGDVVFVDLPDVGERFERGAEFGSVESVKAVSELYMPVGGEVTAVNPELEDNPDLVNSQPYADGWMIRIKPDEPGQLGDLLTREAYLQKLQE